MKHNAHVVAWKKAIARALMAQTVCTLNRWKTTTN